MLRKLYQTTILSVYPLHKSLFQTRALTNSARKIDYQPYQVDRLTWDAIQHDVHALEKRNPLAIEVLHRIDIEGMSLGSISPVTHGHIAQAVMAIAGVRTHQELVEKYYSTDHLLTSNCGEGGDLNKHLAKQLASARLGVDLDYIIEAVILQFKAAQGVKPGVGGALSGFKVNELIAYLRRCEPWNDIYSPGPHADQYSIEDLRLLLKGYLLANSRALTSIKLASEPGVDTIALGSLKAMGMSEQGRRNNIVITGKGSTGNTPLFTKYHTTFPWIVGLARTHARIVHAGLRDNVTLTASGGFVGSFFAPFLWGADRVGIATMALVGDGCIMVRKCHDNTCPTGVATQDPLLIAKNTGSAHSIARVLLAAAELTALEMQPYFDHVAQAVGRAPDVLEVFNNGPLTGQEEYLSLMKKRPRFISLKKLPHQSGPSYKESEVIEAIRLRKQTHFSIQSNNEEIAFGTRLSALTKTDADIRQVANEQPITLQFSGFTGQNLGILGADGIVFDASHVHTNDSTGKSLSGAELYAKTCGNQAGFAMTEGLLVTRGVGSRGAVRKSGGVFMTEYAGAFFANFHTRGTTIILGKPEHYHELRLAEEYLPPFLFKEHALDFGFLSGFSGGSIIIPNKLWKEALDLKHVSPTISHLVKVGNLSEEDKATLIAALKKGIAHLDSALQRSILAAIEKNPELIEQWFVKISPPLPKATNLPIGQIALAEEKLLQPTAKEKSSAPQAVAEKQKANPNIVIAPDREKAACGTSLVMQLDRKATHEIVALGVKALGSSEHRGASGGDPLSGDGCGLMVGYGAGFFENMPELTALNLQHRRFGVISIFMPKNQHDFVSAEAVLKQATLLFGLQISGKRNVPTNEEKLGIQAKADEIQLMHYIVESNAQAEQLPLTEFDQQLAKTHLHVEFTAQQMQMEHKAHICSASRYYIVYKTKGKEKNIAHIYPDLTNPMLTATVVMGHSRFATNTDTLIESVQPLSMAMFNGEINNLRRFIEELTYHPQFGKLIKVNLSKFDFTRYSDSAIMSFYMKMLQLLGYNSQQIHDAIFHPYSPKQENAVAEFHDLIGIPGLEGPDGSIRVYESGEEATISIEMDSLGWRPHRGIIDEKRRILVTGSELGLIPELSGDVIELGPGEAIEINVTTGTFKPLKTTSAAQGVFADKLANIAAITPSDTYEYTPFELSSAKLNERKLRANITPEIEKTILEPMYENGKGFTVSMGDDGGDEVTVSGPTRFVNTLKTHFAQITRPPLDYLREGEVMSGMTFIGTRALPEAVYTHDWQGLRVDNPILDNDQMHFLLRTDKVTTQVIDCTYPVRGRDAAMLAAIERVAKSCIDAANQGMNVIVLSDIKTNANQAPILPAIIAGTMDLALRKAGLRHQVTLCLQSSICVTPLEQIAAIALGINVINPYLIFMPDKLYAENKEKFIRQRKSYLQIALKEILAAAARVGIRTLSAGYQGARQVSALGLDKEVADSLGIYSELAGIDWANIAATVTDMHTRPGNINKYQHSSEEPRVGKWNVPLVSMWRSIAKGEKTLSDILPEMLRNIKSAERDNVEGWFKKKPPMIWTSENPMTVIIIGGGAAGFMQAQALLNSPMGTKIKIKILEENPANLFGMVKDGIAPEKQETKKMQFTLLSQCLSDSRVEYYGGIEVGKKGTVTFDELNQQYPCVIDCRGAPNDREATEIEGHALLVSASKVWKAYNGYFDPLNPDRYWPFKEYTRSQVKMVIGNGNVAADIIRNLLTTADNLDSTAINPSFYDRLRKKQPSFIRNIARGSVTQCKITLKELESFEKNGIQVRASFDDKNINETALNQEQVEKLKFFRRAKTATPVLSNQVCVHFHFGCTPKKVYSVGRNILEMEIIDESGTVEYFRGGDFISAIGRDIPEEESNTPFVAGWVSGNGGNLTVIQQSVASNTASILAHDEKRGFDHTKGPASELAWERHASVTNQGFLNILSYYADGHLLNTIADWRKARDYQTSKPTQPAEVSVTSTINVPSLSVINPVTSQPIPITLNKSSKSVYHALKEEAVKNPEIPIPDNECSEAGTCMRCVAETSKPINLKSAEKINLTAIFGKKSAGLFLTCQHPVDDLAANGAQVMTVKNPVSGKR